MDSGFFRGSAVLLDTQEPKSRMSTNSITGAYSVFEITGVENGAVNLSLR